MRTLDAHQQFATLTTKEKPEDYNFEHFRTKHFVQDLQRTITSQGIQPGELAPDFELPQVGGGSLRLSDLRGKPTVLHFGSLS